MNILWRREEVLKALSGRAVGDIPEAFSDIIIDSRHVSKDSVFFAIKGARFDGHDFALAAHKNGASLVIIDEAHAEIFAKEAVPHVVVKDVLQALTDLARAARARAKAKIIAITGSVGKTTTKELTRFMLQFSKTVHANPGSFNNHWGLPLTLARLPQDSQYAIFELGMNHKGEIAELVRLLKPHVALITNVAAAHFGNFSSLAEIAQAKAEIFLGLEDDGIALLPKDDSFFSFFEGCAQKYKIKTFGRDLHADYVLLKEDYFEEYSVLHVDIEDRQALFRLNSTGAHNSYDCLAALSIIASLNIDIMPLLGYLSQWQPLSGRGRRYCLKDAQGSFVLIDETYNASPLSMAAALKNLCIIPISFGGRRIAILGDMLELGAMEEKFHKDLLPYFSSGDIAFLFLIGKNMRTLGQEIEQRLAGKVSCLYFSVVEEALSIIPNYIKNGDIVMVKSSHSIGTYKIVQKLLEKYNYQGETK